MRRDRPKASESVALSSGLKDRPSVSFEGDCCTTLVLFGVTGDLARRKTFQALYKLHERDDLEGTSTWTSVRVIGVGRSDWTDSRLRRVAGQAVRSSERDDIDAAVLRRLQSNLSYLRGDPAKSSLYKDLADRIDCDERVLCYLAVPPEAFGSIVDGLGGSPLRGVRLLVEKPFGTNSASARELSTTIDRHLSPEEVYPVDHYLEKPAVERLSSLRKESALLDHAWSSDGIESVEITLSEQLSIDGRAGFFDSIGTIRDVLQNHAMQIVSAIALEAPSSGTAGALTAARLALIDKIHPARPADLTVGQYDGYRDVDGVATESMTETFASLRLVIDSKQWKGTRFQITAGKALDATRTEVRIRFRPWSDRSSNERIATFDDRKGDTLVVTLAPTESIELRLRSGEVLSSRRRLSEVGLSAYSRVLDDALRGDHRRFVGREVIVSTWRIFEPVLHRDNAPLHIYAPGSSPNEVATSPLLSPATLESTPNAVTISTTLIGASLSNRIEQPDGPS